MIKDSEIRIGINIGKAEHEDRGITVYTRNILGEFGQLGSDYRFVLLHYPGSAQENKFGINNAELRPLSYPDKPNPLLTMFGEQILNPIQESRLKLDIVWHPHNRCQFIVPVGYVCTMHDVLPMAQPNLADQYLNSFGKNALYLSRVGTASRADKIIAVSEFSKGEIVKHLGVSPEKIAVIYSGIDLNLFRPNKGKYDRARVRKTYSLPSRYMLTTGSYAPHKNLRVLVDAYNQSELPKKGIGLVIVGPNDATGYKAGYNEMGGYVQKLGILDKVKLLPSVPLEDLIAIYSNAELFATTSLYEGFGFTPLEAMACEIPVVVSNTSALPEVCGDAALYSDPYDTSGFSSHFNSLVNSKDMREKLISAGLLQARKYDWQTSARKTLDILCSAIRLNK